MKILSWTNFQLGFLFKMNTDNFLQLTKNVLYVFLSVRFYSIKKPSGWKSTQCTSGEGGTVKNMGRVIEPKSKLIDDKMVEIHIVQEQERSENTKNTNLAENKCQIILKFINQDWIGNIWCALLPCRRSNAKSGMNAPKLRLRTLSVDTPTVEQGSCAVHHVAALM